MRPVILLQLLVSLALVTEQASVRERKLSIPSHEDDDLFPNNLSDFMSGFRTQPVPKTDQRPNEVKEKRTELDFSKLTDFPFKDKISGRCLESIVRQICNKVFPGLREMEFPTYETIPGEEGSFFCNASGCQIQILQEKYCKNLQRDFSMSSTLNAGENSRSTFGNNDGNNNLDPACARYITEETYKEVRREGWRCERDLRCICRDCVPIPIGKYHHHHHHYHHNRQGNHLSPLAKLLLADLHRSQMPVAKKVVLEKLLQESVNELIPKHPMFQNSSSVRVTNIERNLPLQG